MEPCISQERLFVDLLVFSECLSSTRWLSSCSFKFWASEISSRRSCKKNSKFGSSQESYSTSENLRFVHLSKTKKSKIPNLSIIRVLRNNPLWNLFPVVLKWYQTWIELYNTLLTSIFITGVHPPSPHPTSPRWQKTETGVESKLRVKAWLICDLLNKAEMSKKERMMNF